MARSLHRSLAAVKSEFDSAGARDVALRETSLCMNVKFGSAKPGRPRASRHDPNVASGNAGPVTSMRFIIPSEVQSMRESLMV